MRLVRINSTGQYGIIIAHRKLTIEVYYIVVGREIATFFDTEFTVC